MKQLDRSHRLLEDLLWLQHETGSLHPVNISVLIRDVIERIKAESGATIRCLFLTKSEEYVAGVESHLWRALYNLILNGAEAAGESGEVLVRVSFKEAGEAVVIEIEDNGPGMPTELQKNLFTAFTTTKEGHVGLGMGLAKEIIEEHRGSLSLQSEPEKGTIFTIELPLLSA